RGDDPVYVAVGENYTEPGAEGVDAMDGAGFDTALDATDPKDITKTNDVDTNVMGQYTRVYTATDAAGNIATLNRQVIVGPAVTMTADNKQLHFDWPLPANTTLYANHDHYRLLFDRDGSGTFSAADAASSSIAGTSHSVDTSAHLFNWNDARYRVESCDATESDCLGSPLGRFRGENELSSAGYSVDIINYFKASDTTAGAQFGTSVAVSSDGTTMAVGAPNQDSGIVYIFVRDTSVTPPVWSQQGRVSAGGAGDKFGFSVALSSDGSTLAVGAQLEDSSVGGIDPTANDSA
ncbi:immunoglobulin-like domain-containing protein, partial [endosymbiont of Riftia pachyptila]|uniref:immunoglobulin-like domain-containing protein n=1 Tax=endosymbiont of Riftia pachyptila TaxID=54396 RepID=UPI001111E1D5